MNLSRKLTILAVGAALVMWASPAFAGVWTTSGGSTDTFGGALSFTYSNGGDINGFFGEPFIFGDAFFFTASSFSVNAMNGATDSQTDTVSFDILADPGLQFSSITVTANGSFAITDEGSVDVDAGLSMKENPGGPVSPPREFLGALDTFEADGVTPLAFPITTPSSGLWNGNALVDVTFVFPTPHNDIHIELTNDVLAIAGPMGTAEVNVAFEDLSIEFTVIPEPATLALLASGALLLVGRRRRR